MEYGIELIFIATVLITFFAAYWGRKKASTNSDNGIVSNQLNKWMIGLSAGATANSGFVVTGAVGLGYLYGMQWILLPIAWLLGDLLFWRIFPQKINSVARRTKANTLTQLIIRGTGNANSSLLKITITALIVILLTGYISAQWLAGQKFLNGAFAIEPAYALILFAILIVSYSSIGGFKGSVFADATQAVIRMVGTLISIAAIFWVSYDSTGHWFVKATNAGDNFYSLIGGMSFFAAVSFIIGFAFAALGFGLGQPQIITRYMAGKSEKETQQAQWIYISFVQFTWISMTLFGVLLRSIQPEISDPEQGLSIFFKDNFHFIITGIIVADIFATIAASTNSLLVSVSQSVVHDLFGKSHSRTNMVNVTVFFIGGITMIFSLFLQGSSVFSLAIGSVSLLGAALAVPVIWACFNQKTSQLSLFVAIFIGLLSAFFWKQIGFNGIINESAIGITSSFCFLALHWFLNKEKDHGNSRLAAQTRND